MPEMQAAQRLDCAHCDKSGKCRCAKCVVIAKLPNVPEAGQTEKVPCSVCRGVGTAEPDTLKFLNMFLPIFSAAFVGLLLMVMFVLAIRGPETIFHEFVAFAGTAIGSVTGYYFGGARRQSSS